MKALIIFLILPLCLAGIIWLQVFLSKRKNRWLGLVIPMICFIFSIIFVLSLTMYTTNTTNKAEIRTENINDSITENTTENINENINNAFTEQAQAKDNIIKPSIGNMLAKAISVFLATNISTIIFSAIYLACREKLKSDKELEKMNVQDLE